MAARRKTYFLSPSWELKPTEVEIGSVIANFDRPGANSLSSPALLSLIDTDIHTGEEKNCSGTTKTSSESSIGLFSKFINIIILGGEVSYSSSTNSEVKYSCDTMETKRFTPSFKYLQSAVNEERVKAHLQCGFGSKVFMITGVKTVTGLTITTIENTGKNANAQVGFDIPAAQLTVGPKATYAPTEHNEHTRNISGPIVFAFQVEKLSLNIMGQVSSKEYISGAFLGRDEPANNTEYVIERGGELDDDEIDEFGAEASSGLEDDTKKICRIITPPSRVK